MTMTLTRIPLPVVIAVMLLTVGTGGSAQAGRRAPVAQLTIEAADFSFRAPRFASAGWTTIRLKNGGPSFHHVVLLRLKPGESRDSVLTRTIARQGDPDSPIPGAVSVGGPEGHMPAGDSYATVNLVVGEYLIVCLIPSSNGRNHAARGMFAPLTVVPGLASQLAAPPSDLVVSLSDYSFGLSKTEVQAGWRTLRVENAGPAEHIAELARLQDGRTAADLLRWLAGATAEPIVTVGGSTRVAVGGMSFVHVNLQRGRYVLLCMLQDRGDRQHVALGMFKEFTVK